MKRKIIITLKQQINNIVIREALSIGLLFLVDILERRNYEIFIKFIMFSWNNFGIKNSGYFSTRLRVVAYYDFNISHRNDLCFVRLGDDVV